MEKLDLNEVKGIELDILKSIDNFCATNNIKYFLDSGTLIGAVRHKGFIPWDDDVDISMPRKDYEMFVSSFNELNSKYKVLSFNNNSKYVYPFAKVVDTSTRLIEEDVIDIPDLGVYIDVFPIDGLPENYISRRVHQFKILFWKLVAVYDVEEAPNLSKFRYKILDLFARIIGWKKALKKCDKLLKKYDMYKTKYAFPVVYNRTSDWKIESDVFYEQVKLQFEDSFFCVPKGYDSYLQVQYGDYMQLPAEDKRVNKHRFIATYK